VWLVCHSLPHFSIFRILMIDKHRIPSYLISLVGYRASAKITDPVHLYSTWSWLNNTAVVCAKTLWSCCLSNTKHEPTGKSVPYCWGGWLNLYHTETVWEFEAHWFRSTRLCLVSTLYNVLYILITEHSIYHTHISLF